MSNNQEQEKANGETNIQFMRKNTSCYVVFKTFGNTNGT